MDCQFIISKISVDLLITVRSEGVKVDAMKHCKYDKSICDILANSEEMLISGYLRKLPSSQNICNSLVRYYEEKKWVITEVKPGRPTS